MFSNPHIVNDYITILYLPKNKSFSYLYNIKISSFLKKYLFKNKTHYITKPLLIRIITFRGSWIYTHIINFAMFSSILQHFSIPIFPIYLNIQFVYIYIYIYRERERERVWLVSHVYIYIYIYSFMHGVVVLLTASITCDLPWSCFALSAPTLFGAPLNYCELALTLIKFIIKLYSNFMSFQMVDHMRLTRKIIQLRDRFGYFIGWSMHLLSFLEDGIILCIYALGGEILLNFISWSVRYDVMVPSWWFKIVWIKLYGK